MALGSAKINVNVEVVSSPVRVLRELVYGSDTLLECELMAGNHFVKHEGLVSDCRASMIVVDDQGVERHIVEGERLRLSIVMDGGNRYS